MCDADESLLEMVNTKHKQEVRFADEFLVYNKSLISEGADLFLPSVALVLVMTAEDVTVCGLTPRKLNKERYAV